jgi:long-chain acyl-CoA synthetase
MENADGIQTIVALLEHHSNKRPTHPAILMDGTNISYAEVNRRANQVAHGLLSLGVKPANRFALLSKNHWSFFELLFGAAKAGAVMVPVNVRLTVLEITWILADAKAEVLFYGPEFEVLIDQIREHAPALKHLIPLSETDGGYESWRNSYPTYKTEHQVKQDDICLQIYTSGTTGHPKGAQITHQNLISCGDSCIAAWGDWKPSDVSLIVMPLFHIGATAYAFIGLRAGATLSILRDADPMLILQSIERDHITVALFVPALMLALVNLPPQDRDLSSLRLIAYGTAPMPLELLRRSMKVFECGFVQLYGLTETTAPITYLPPEDHDPNGNRRMRSCGLAAPGVEIRIVDEAGRVRGAGEVGEIICRTAQIMKGYWKQPSATMQSIRDGWLYTGDAGYMDDDGYLYIHDRIKDLIVSGGENVYPAEVENAIFGHPAVADVAVIGIPDERWGEAVKACVVLKAGQAVTADEIIDFARHRIAGFKTPRSVDFLSVLPRNSTGKVLKRELRQPYWAMRDRQVN